VPAIYLGM